MLTRTATAHQAQAGETAEAALPDLPEEHFVPGTAAVRYVVCAFYTPNYLPQVASLMRSLDALGLPYYVKRYQRAATWEATTRLKPVFINHCLAKFPDKDILYLDADAVVRRPMTFFDDLNADVSLLFHPTVVGKTHYLRISAGTVYIANTEGGRRFARLWKEQEARCAPLTLDEDMIYMAFADLAGVSIRVLPPTYYKIFDKAGGEPVIEHFQASRGQFKWRRVIRKAKRIGTGVAIAAGVVLLWYLSRRITIGWK